MDEEVGVSLVGWGPAPQAPVTPRDETVILLGKVVDILESMQRMMIEQRPPKTSPYSAPKIDEARQFLVSYLRENPGGVEWKQIETAALQEGHRTRAMHRARGSVATWERMGNQGRAVYWYLKPDLRGVA